MQEKESLIPFLILSLLVHILFLGGMLLFSSRIDNTIQFAGSDTIIVTLGDDFSQPVSRPITPPPVEEEPTSEPEEPVVSEPKPEEPEPVVVPDLEPPQELAEEETVTLPDPEKKVVEEKKTEEEPKKEPPLVKRSKTVAKKSMPPEDANRNTVDAALAEIEKKLKQQEDAAKKGGISGATGASVGRRLESTRAEDFYRTQVALKVQQNWTYAGSGTTKGGVIVAFRVTRNGRVQNFEMEQSSGNNLIDESAKRAVLKAEPFSPIPASISESVIIVRLRFTDKGVVR